MNMVHTADSAWALEQLTSHINYTGWFFAIVCGLMMWTLMIGAAI